MNKISNYKDTTKLFYAKTYPNKKLQLGPSSLSQPSTQLYSI